MWSTAAAALAVLVGLAGHAAALGQRQCIVFPSSDHHHHHQLSTTGLQQVIFDEDQDSALAERNFLLASAAHSHPTPILLDSKDDIAIHIAVKSFADDIKRVTGLQPKIYNDTLPHGIHSAVVVGSASSGLVGGYGLEHVTALEGQWEAFDVRVVNGFRGLDRALVIAGSDRRGTVFGMYDLSEQMGVSPWYWWSDVHTPKHGAIAFKSDCIAAHGPPTVKYRGLFINDEIPVMWNWAKKTWNISYPESPFQVGVYEKVFETVLRMKGNYMWPAMWVSMFDVDGLNPQKNGLPKEPIPGPNQLLAHNMGIFMGASHHEPMARNKPEWDLEGTGDWDWRNNKDKLTEWWRYGAKRAKGLDTVFTVGMRGDGDRPLEGASKELLEEIVAHQQEMIKTEYDVDDVSTVPQLWCLYKEVMGYFLDGLKVPDEVTTLFADDNWGNIMGVLSLNSTRSGGGGIYYHADYVGRPTQYKWVNTINNAKTWEQMQLLKAFKTTEMWIINVGDVKHHELPAEWFMALAYDFDAWSRNSMRTFLNLWAKREFGGHETKEIADIVDKYTFYTSRLKPELYRPYRFSFINYNEAERVLDEWNDLFDRAERVLRSLPKVNKPAFFEYVYAPVALVAQANRMYLSVGWNNLHADQARTSANRYAEKGLAAFRQDMNLTNMYHQMLDGKWDHILSQPHLNQKFFLHQLRNTMPPVSFIQEGEPAIPRWDGTIPGGPSYVRYTVENSYGAWPGHNYYNCPTGYDCPDPTMYRMDPYGQPTRWVDVSAGGPKDSTWRAVSSANWLKATPDHGLVTQDGTSDARVHISVDWDQLDGPEGDNDYRFDNATVHFAASDGSNVTVACPVAIPRRPDSGFAGFVQGDGYVVMEASHFTHNKTIEGFSFEEIEAYGRSISGLEMFPSTEKNFTAGQGPSLTYDFWATGVPATSNEWDGKVNVTVQLGPTFNFMIGKELAFGLQLDDGDVREIHPIPPTATFDHSGSTPVDWDQVVIHEIRNATASFDLRDAGKAGKHSITIYGMTAGVVVERIWVDFGGIMSRGYSYFGPPESKGIWPGKS